MEYSVSNAAERNKTPILEVLAIESARTRHVLEIGSGTGQHALHFSAHLPHLSWQPSDTGDYLPALRERLRQAGAANLRPVIELDVRKEPWPVESVDGVFSANTLHIMSWPSVQDFFRGVGNVLGRPGALFIYGPFRYGERYTSESNARFDGFLRQRDPESGIRDADELDRLAAQQGLELTAEYSLPANNQLRVWRRLDV
jgi:SAM-dependent methyltransferase